MKLTIFLLTAALLQVHANGISQTISLHAKEMPLQKIFTEVEKQTGFVFLYASTTLNGSKPVSVQATKLPLLEFLDQVLEGQSLKYVIKSRSIIISRSNNDPAAYPGPGTQASLFLSVDVHGRIVNEQDEGVIASIIIKGTSRGTTSNDEGYFEMKQVQSNAVLVITGVSLEQKAEVYLNGRTDLGTIRVKTRITEGKEVVVSTNYWQTKRSENPGNISLVTAKEIERQPVSNPLQALQGRVPGLLITQQTGVAGSGFKVEIRGQNSLRNKLGDNGNLPLYVVDGIPFTSSTLTQLGYSIVSEASPLNNFNPYDIQSIEVLKDADATAIYGSRGANGVILITTKRGKAGKTQTGFNVYTGVGRITRTMNLLSRQQYLEMRKEGFANDNGEPQSYDYDLTFWDTTRYTDWQKAFISGSSHTTDAQASVSGGSAGTQFLLSGGYHRETAVFPGDFADQKASVHFNLNNKSVNGKFQSALTASYILDDNLLPSYDPTQTAVTLSPVAPELYTEDGKLNWAEGTFDNPAAYLFRTYSAKTKNLVGNLLLSYQLLPGLQVKSTFGYTDTRMDETIKTPLSSLNTYWGYTSGYVDKSNTDIHSWIIEPQVNWVKRIANIQIDLLAGATFQEQERESSAYNYDVFPADIMLDNVMAASKVKMNGDSYNQYRYNAVFARFNFKWKERYILNLTARRDGSSRFGPGRQFANFGAVGAAWIFSQEQFAHMALPFLSFGKLRVSYGTTGNDQIGDYSFLNTYTATLPYQGSVGLFPARLYNPDFAWETNKKLEVAVEAGLFNDNLFFSASFFRNRSSDQLVGYPLPPTAGFTSVQYNLPATVQNTGMEVEIRTINLRRNNFSWTTAFNFSRIRNKLVSYPGLALSSYKDQYVTGKPLNIIKVAHYLGIDAATGIYQFEDVNNDGRLAFADRQTVMSLTPDFYGGLGNTLTYKGLTLDVFFQYVKQKGLNYLASGAFGAPGSMGNQPVEILNRWQHPGDVKPIQVFTSGLNDNAYEAAFLFGISEEAITDASFVRLKNISLSWELPHSWMQQAHINTVRLYLQCQNLLTITGYKGWDPENQSAANLPPLRIITAGAQFTL